MTAPEVIIRPGRITLNRPHALHALTLGMVRGMTAALLAWRDDPAVETVIIEHGEGRGFCAGGDVRAIVDSLDGDGVLARDFFYEEYQLNHLMFHYAKPLMCFWDGIVMGGGAGIALPCRIRVATDRTRFAMPECGIGLFPDVGAGWYLSRLPDRRGEWLALTGARLNGAQCLELGLATHYLPLDQLAAVKANPGLLQSLAVTPPAESLPMQVFDSTGKSPLSCRVALRQLAEGARARNFAEVLRMEYRIARRIIRLPDFREGVRAFILDKDNSPRWMPPVTDVEIDAIFAPLPPHEEWQPLEEHRDGRV